MEVIVKDRQPHPTVKSYLHCFIACRSGPYAKSVVLPHIDHNTTDVITIGEVLAYAGQELQADNIRLGLVSWLQSLPALLALGMWRGLTSSLPSLPTKGILVRNRLRGTDGKVSKYWGIDTLPSIRLSMSKAILLVSQDRRFVTVTAASAVYHSLRLLSRIIHSRGREIPALPSEMTTYCIQPCIVQLAGLIWWSLLDHHCPFASACVCWILPLGVNALLEEMEVWSCWEDTWLLDIVVQTTAVTHCQIQTSEAKLSLHIPLSSSVSSFICRNDHWQVCKLMTLRKNGM